MLNGGRGGGGERGEENCLPFPPVPNSSRSASFPLAAALARSLATKKFGGRTTARQQSYLIEIHELFKAAFIRRGLRPYAAT